MDHIHKLEDTAQEKSSARAKKSSSRVKESAGRTKRVAVKISSSKAACKTPLSPNSFPSIDEEATPAIPKRKRSSLERRTSVASGAVVEQSKLARPASSLPEEIVHSEPAPSLDPNDHLPIKKLKIQHSQGSDSHTQTSIQTPKPIPRTTNMQPPSTINTRPTVNTQPTILPKQILVVDFDSNEEQGLQSDVLNLFDNPQPTKNPTDQTRAEQVPATETPITGPSAIEKITIAKAVIAYSSAAEQSTPPIAEQAASAEPPQSTEQTAATQITSPSAAQTIPPPAT